MTNQEIPYGIERPHLALEPYGVIVLLRYFSEHTCLLVKDILFQNRPRDLQLTNEETPHGIERPYLALEQYGVIVLFIYFS